MLSLEKIMDALILLLVETMQGEGNYYGPFDAQKIFLQFKYEELGITPLLFDNTFFCRKCNQMVSSKICPHSSDFHISFSGTKIRQMLSNCEFPPEEFTRPEVTNVLVDYYKKY